MQIFVSLKHLQRGLARAPGRLTCAALAGALLAACGGGNDAAVAQAPAAARLLGGAVQGGAAPTVPTASTDEAYHEVVQRIYIAYFGRPADPAGLAYWAGQFRRAAVPATLSELTAAYGGSATVRGLVDSFGASQESKDLYSGDDEEFITAIYRNIFGKEPDMAGKNYWRGLVESAAITRTFAALAIMAGAQAEDIDVVNNKIQVANNFTAAISESQLNASYNGNDANATARTMLGMVSAVTTVVDFQPAVAAAVTTLAPPGYGTLVATGKVLTDIKVQNAAAAAQTNVPLTFGQIFVKGQLLPGEPLVGKLADGGTVALQVDVKATHEDGSVRHAIVSGVLPKLAAGQTQVLTMAKSGPAAAAAASTVTPQALLNAGLSGSVALTVNGVQYSAALRDALLTASPVRWLSGPVVNEWIASAPLKSSAGALHPHLTARFGVRWYPGLSRRARVEVIVENNKTFTPAPQNFTYDVNVQIEGRQVYSQSALTHYHHSRWHKYLWWDQASAPAVHLKHNTAYLIASKAVSNYDQSVVIKESTLASLVTPTLAAKGAAMKVGALNEYMPTSGGRPDIGPLPSWAVMYLLSMDPRPKQVMMDVADGSGSWPMHYRDDATGHPIRLDNAVNKKISTHMNANHLGPLPVPRCANNDGTLCRTPFTPDAAHQPSIAYLPYLVTGDYFYLEELQFWAAWNPTETSNAAQGDGKGLLRWQQLRGQAWSMRTLGHAAYITPDAHYMKTYFNTQLNNNLDFYTATYVTANPNALGVYDGSGASSFAVGSSAPWQDDFFTWSFGYLAELGFTKAEPLLRWKAKYSVGRMTAPGFCWTEGSAYTMQFRPAPTSPLYASFAEVYAASFKNDNITNDDGKLITHPQGLKFLDQPCGSQARADWRTAATGYTWEKNRMVGYSTSEFGNPSIMQMALAVAAPSGVPNARTAWSIFLNRAAKPDYSKGPQFAIVPR